MVRIEVFFETSLFLCFSRNTIVYRGHGLDDNDVVPNIASPSGEGIADIYAALRMGDSCIGRGFYVSGSGCTGKRHVPDCHVGEEPELKLLDVFL